MTNEQHPDDQIHGFPITREEADILHEALCDADENDLLDTLFGELGIVKDAALEDRLTALKGRLWEFARGEDNAR